MPDPFLDPILRRIDRAQRVWMRLGTLTAVDAVDLSVTVSLAGDVVTGVRWVGSYTPVVNDVVVVSRADAQWVILGKLSKQLGAPPVTYGSVRIDSHVTYEGVLASGSWVWDVSGEGDMVYDTGHQGLRTILGVDEVCAGVWRMPVVGALPAGATVTAAKLGLTRHIAGPSDPGEYPLVSVFAYRHAYTTQPVGAPSWIGDPWSPGQLLKGQSGVWDVPSAWLTDLLAGTATGFGVYSPSRVDYTAFYYAYLELFYYV
jgi:hypothetical protein